MRKVTVIFDDSDTVVQALESSIQAIRDNVFRLNNGNIKVEFDKGIKSGRISQRGVSIGLIESRKRG